jgi:hypothetical protein
MTHYHETILGCVIKLYCQASESLWTGFGLVGGFIERLQNAATNNYGRLTELHTPKMTTATAHIKSSQFFTSRCLVAAFNGGRSRSSGFPNCPRPQLPASHFSQLHLSKHSANRGQSQSYFTTGGLPPISSSWCQAPWDPGPVFFSSEHLWL